MSKKAAEHHKQSAEHHTHAARHHGEAAKHHEAGHHEKAAHHAHTARGHALHARHHSDEAAKSHMEDYGKKYLLKRVPLTIWIGGRLQGAASFIAQARLMSARGRFCCKSRLERLGHWAPVGSRGFDAVALTPFTQLQRYAMHRTWAGGGRASSAAIRRRF